MGAVGVTVGPTVGLVDKVGDIVGLLFTNRRTAMFPDTYTFPTLSPVTPMGSPRGISRAGPLLPENTGDPVPAIV